MSADRLGWRELVGYALPAIPTSALALPLTVYVAPFYALQMGLGTALVGALFFWPLMGIDPVPGRVGYPARMLLVVLTLPFHAFLGVAIMGQQALICHGWYPALHDGPMGLWLPDPQADQHLAGGILWGSGDLVGLAFFGVLFAQWVRASAREAAREDRRLDLLEARAASGVARPDATVLDG